MSSLVSHKTSPSPLSSSYGDERELPPSPSPPPPAPSSVTRCIYLKPPEAAGGGEQRGSLNKEVVLRRIRHRKRVNRLRSALQSLLIKPASAGAGDGDDDCDGEPHSWLDNAFSFH